MTKEKKRLLIFRLILLIIVVVCMESIGYLALWYNSRSFDWLSNKHYFAIRAMLIGDRNPELFPRYLSVPFLGYIPYPGYEKYGVVQHNEDGYRGNRVPQIKTNKFRVLCLGGSTTYGSGVKFPGQTYPAQLEALLNNYIAHDSMLKRKYTGAEVINAGIESGTSAEELQQYTFKYRYYHPDAVIVHSGINDAMLVTDNANYQLDYTHYRRINFHLEALPMPMRFFLKSYFISFLSIQLFYNRFSVLQDEYKPQYHQTYCKWTQINIDSVVARKQYEYYPFYQNSRSLYHEIVGDSACLIVLPSALNRNNNFIKTNLRYDKICDLNTKISESLCNTLGGTFVMFSFDSIKDPQTWVDDCHLNAAGESEKAQILLPALINILNR